MKHWQWIFLALSPLLVAAVLVVVPRMSGGVDPVQAQGLELALDMDITDGGPCASIDSSVSHTLGDNYGVGVCIMGMGATAADALSAFQVSVRYDDTLNSSPDNPCAPTDTNCLDDNPDANAGVTTWGTSLGDGWNCSGFGAAPTEGDRDDDTGAGQGEAYMGCTKLQGPFTFGDDETSGVLAVISFTAIAGGDPVPLVDTLTFTDVVIADTVAAELGSCNPTIIEAMECTNGDDSKLGPTAPTPTSTATQIPTMTPIRGTLTPTVRAWTITPSPEPTGTPEAPTSEPPPAEPVAPPPPPAGGAGPAIVPPATGTGGDDAGWTRLATWGLGSIGLFSIAFGGLYLYRSRK